MKNLHISKKGIREDDLLEDVLLGESLYMAALEDQAEVACFLAGASGRVLVDPVDHSGGDRSAYSR